MAEIELRSIRKQLKDEGNSFSISDLNLSVPHGKTLVILGPSGCGKTTLLKIIAGLKKIDSGSIMFNGKDVTDESPKDRHIGMVFQNYALYPHLTARNNILSYFFFRKTSKQHKHIIEERLQATSKLLEINPDYLLDKMPKELSGGERQRVALGRCITREAELYLMDEPFANLDAQLRSKYRLHLKKLLKTFDVTTVFVTHDQKEAQLFADTIAIMDNGRIVQSGTFEELYTNPGSLFVAEFLNLDTTTPAINLLNGDLVSEQLRGYSIGIRPEDFDIYKIETEQALSCKVSAVTHNALMSYDILELEHKGITLYAQSNRNNNMHQGDMVWITFTRSYVFDRNTGEPVEVG